MANRLNIVTLARVLPINEAGAAMGLQRRVIRRLPVWVRSNPLDVMFILILTPSSVLSLAGVAQSNAMAQTLPWWGTKLAAVALLTGCVFWAVGITSVHANNGILVLSRMPALLLGLHVVSVTTLSYAVLVFTVSGRAGVTVGAYLLAMAGGTWLRRIDLADQFQGEP